MTHCEKCINYDMCNYEYEHQDTDAILTFFPNNTDCPWFKNKADFVEVRHSRWENISGFDVCNICGTSPAYCEPKPNNPKGYPPYCHHCGAKMDGERRDT